jgi:hypothetical protein
MVERIERHSFWYRADLHAVEGVDWAEVNRAKKRKRMKEKACFGIVMEVARSACNCD